MGDAGTTGNINNELQRRLCSSSAVSCCYCVASPFINKMLSGELTFGSTVRHAGIRFRVGDVRQQVHDDEDAGQEQHGALNRRKVTTRDGVHDVPPESRPREYRLGEDAAGEVRAEV